MRRIQYTVTLLALLLTSSIIYAQAGEDKVDMADTMRSNGRIYVVVAVVLAILIGLILYLVRLDRKITRMERQKP